jgi:hypothetical protein
MPRGNARPALESFRASLSIAERLAKADPGNAEWQRDLSVSHERIGDGLRAQGDLSAALESYKADLAIAERLAMADRAAMRGSPTQPVPVRQSAGAAPPTTLPGIWTKPPSFCAAS